LTFPFDHFFFFADLPPLDAAGAAFALAYSPENRVSYCCRGASKVETSHPSSIPEHIA
jgi:hypothetical protein